MQKILMIAYHFPPIHGSSGVHRTLKFARYLLGYSWQPIILSPSIRAYPKVENDQVNEIPTSVKIVRAFALDTARHLSLNGFYPKVLALPDRWISWWLGSIPAGIRLIRRYQPKIIWSTYPIATAHLIGLTLQRLTRLPWVADFRDPMTESDYPPDRVTWELYRRIESGVVANCTKAVFTTTGTMQMYTERYPSIPKSRWMVIANGYDEEDFAIVEQGLTILPNNNKQIVLVHSGILYPSERDPTAFFEALAELQKNKAISSENIRIILRGSGNEEYYQRQLKDKGIDDIVFLEPSISYRDAIAEMICADGLLIFQASNCNRQIPAKIYEYLRARRPIFALTDAEGDTAKFLRTVGIDTIAPWNSKEAISIGLLQFLQKVREGCAPIAADDYVRQHSRQSKTQDFAKLLDSFGN